ncbi:hypothetical protein [Sphaerisporangium album]|uniref:hypothetical protein n=1 Tax=Sphaerisporangium album TaxID=509200 RepID=UPI0015F01A3B|nr:hypothetical protein [Sphaerisporangium album]
MRKTSTLPASLALATGSLLLSAAPVQAAPVQAAPVQAAPAQAVAASATGEASAGARTALAARVKVSYPRGMRRGGYATYTYKVTNAGQLQDDALVLTTILPSKAVSKVRFVKKPPHASCGYRSLRVYCVVRLGSANTLGMQFRVYVKYKYAGNFMADHYWTPVSYEPGLGAWDYVREVSRDDRIGRSKTKISLR